MSSRQPVLIITGDDFGYSEAVNRAIIRAHREGVLTHASLMVNENAAAEAVELARAHPSLSIGLHVSLVLGRSALDSHVIPHLATSSGQFASSPFRAGLKYFFNREARREIRLEMRAQFERFAASGLHCSHVDGHNHLHMHPVVFDELARLCVAYRVERVRMVGNEAPLHRESGARLRPAAFAIGTTFELLARSCRNRLSHEGVDLRPVKVYGLLATGRIDEDYLTRLIEEIDFEDAEIYLHPLGNEAPEGERAANPNGPRELAALLSPKVKFAIEKRGFQLAKAAFA